jgi:hypothetical protein
VPAISRRANDSEIGCSRLSRRGLAVPVRFWREPTKAGLLDRLRLIAADVRNTGQAPIIDLQTLGDLDRLQVTSCERVTWSDLKAPLIEINVACGLNLLVLVGACDGEALLRVLEAHDRAPVWGLIGVRRGGAGSPRPSLTCLDAPYFNNVHHNTTYTDP